MFEINDGREKREELLDRIFNADPCAGFIIACMDFEWTVRRGIMALGQSTTMVIREKFHGGLKYNKVEQSGNSGIKNKQNDSVKRKFICGLEEYKQLWNFEVRDRNGEKTSLYNILNNSVVIDNIEGLDPDKFKSSYIFEKSPIRETYSILKIIYDRMRNTLVHGSRSHVDNELATYAFLFIKECSRALVKYIGDQDTTIYKKIIRRKPRYTETSKRK